MFRILHLITDSLTPLLSPGDGLFLVRNSSNCNTGDLVLSMTHSGQVKHFQITQRGGRYIINPRIKSFKDLYSSSHTGDKPSTSYPHWL